MVSVIEWDRFVATERGALDVDSKEWRGPQGRIEPLVLDAWWTRYLLIT